MVIERDGDVCVHCGRGVDEGAVLQVHHKSYIQNRKLWEYPIGYCETVCSGCHAVIHGKIPPANGWQYVTEEDTGGYGDAECEYCGEPLRYVFTIWHDGYGFLDVGTVCCDDLTGTKIASLKRSHEEKKKRFLSSNRWKYDHRTRVYSINQDGWKVKIFTEDIGFRIYIGNHKGGKMYPSIDQAKERVYEGIIDGSIPEYFKRLQRRTTDNSDR